MTRINYEMIEKKVYAKCLGHYKAAIKAGCEPAKDWYKDAYKAMCDIATATGYNPVVVAGVVSALSPRNKWTRNLVNALSLINAHRSGKDIDSVKVCTFHANKSKAWEILDGTRSPLPDYNKSPKTHSFIQNILGYSSFVTVDVWHTRLLIGKDAPGSLRMYRAIERATYRAALKIGIEPAELQAILWVYARDVLGATDARNERLK